MSNKFKPGDLVFELKGDRIAVGKLTKRGENTVRLEGGSTTYISSSGYALGNLYLGKLFLATAENRVALVTLYGEDAVPEIPVRGSELTKKLLEKQKYVMCLVSGISDDAARSNDPPRVYAVSGIIMDYFDLSDGSVSDYAVPIDVDGNEITVYEGWEL